jgi:hypothetical protein
MRLEHTVVESAPPGGRLPGRSSTGTRSRRSVDPLQPESPAEVLPRVAASGWPPAVLRCPDDCAQADGVKATGPRKVTGPDPPKIGVESDRTGAPSAKSSALAQDLPWRLGSAPGHGPSPPGPAG